MDTKCERCNKVLPEIMTLHYLLNQNRLDKDVIGIILPFIIKYNTEIRELETPCSSHWFVYVECFTCRAKASQTL